MSNIERDIELIEKYFREELNEDEIKEVELKQLTDSEFKENFEWYGNLLEVTKEEGNKEIKKILMEVEENRGKRGDVDKYSPFRKRWLGMAATLIMITGTALFFISSEYKTNRLFEKYFQLYPNELVQIERSSGGDTSDLQKAMIYYLQGKHDTAVGEFNRIQAENQLNKIQFYKAISLLAQGESKQSMALLQALNIDNDFALAEAVDWYIALNYLKLNKEFEAREKLEEIMESDQEYQRSSVSKLLKSL